MICSAFQRGVLFEPVLVPALGGDIAQTGAAARLVRDIVLGIAVLSWSSAVRPGAGSMPDLGEVPELDPGAMTAGLEAMITFAEGRPGRARSSGRVARPWWPAAVSAGWPILAGGGERKRRG